MKNAILALVVAVVVAVAGGLAWRALRPDAQPPAPAVTVAPVQPQATPLPAGEEDGAARTAFLVARGDWLGAREGVRRRIPQADFILPAVAADEAALAGVDEGAVLRPEEWLAWRERALAATARYRDLLPQIAPWQAALAAAEQERATWTQLAAAEALGMPAATATRERDLVARATELARTGRFAEAAVLQQQRATLFHGLVGAGTAVPPHRDAAAAQRQRWLALGVKTESAAPAHWQRAQAEATAGAFAAAVASFDQATRAYEQDWRAARLRAALPVMVDVPAGRFRMGDLQGKGQRDEQPVREASVARFALSVDEISYQQYAAYAELSGRRLPPDNGRGDRPVTDVTWSEARDYAAWLSEMTGDAYRLPTEREWEYAARAGSEAPYASGDRLDPGLAVCEGCSGWGNGAAQAVGLRRANAFGLRDMHGNVWEWVEDCYRASYADDARPDCAQRVLRGGSWADLPPVLRASNRSPVKAGFSSSSAGFRIARDP